MTPKKSDLLETLRTRVLTLAIAPGAALDEAALAEEFGVSRTPLREVFQKLDSEGYISLRPGRSAVASSMDMPRMRQFFQTAPMIYAATTRLAAEHRGAGRVPELRAIQAKFCVATLAGDADQAALFNHHFHNLIGEMAGNPYLSAALDRLLIDHTRLSEMFFSPAGPDEAALVGRAVSDHDQMIAAIAAGEAARAVEITLAHWALSRDRMERFVRPDPLEDPLNREALP
ncbi:MAG: GntR family transcriptional regulator [Pseudomonadota bacterium]